MAEFALFLNGRYDKKSLPIYKRIGRGKIMIAVDGGCRFFTLAGLIPHYLIGDLDSINRFTISPKTKVLRHPPDKNKTDSELALEFCIGQGADLIEIVDPSVGEVDHFLGNIMLLNLASALAPDTQVRLVSKSSQIILLDNSSASFEKCQGEAISIIPFDQAIKLSCRGTAYDVTDCRIKPGESRGLRNRIVKSEAEFEVAGKALLIHRF